jgi:hypothetical protein
MSEAFDWLQRLEGWDAVNRTGLTAEEAAEVQRRTLAEFETSKLYADVFMNGRGPELLEHWRERLFETPTIHVAGSIGHNQIDMVITPEQWLWIRAGQNSVLHHVLAMIDMAREGPPKIEAEQTEQNDGRT